MPSLPPPQSTVGRINGPAGTYFVKRVDRPKNSSQEDCVKALKFTASHANDADDLRLLIDMLGLQDAATRYLHGRQAS